MTVAETTRMDRGTLAGLLDVLRRFVRERLDRDVRVFGLYEGTTQIQQLIVARDMIRARRRHA